METLSRLFLAVVQLDVGPVVARPTVNRDGGCEGILGNNGCTARRVAGGWTAWERSVLGATEGWAESGYMVSGSWARGAGENVDISGGLG